MLRSFCGCLLCDKVAEGFGADVIARRAKREAKGESTHQEIKKI